MSEPFATDQEVANEFRRRDKKKDAERALKPQPSNQPVVVANNGGVPMSGNVDQPEQENNAPLPPYKQGPRKYTILYSTYDAQYIFMCLKKNLESRADEQVTVCKIAPDKWKITYEREKESEEEEEKEAEKIKVSIELFQMANEIICIDFMKVAGDARFFFEDFDKIKGDLDFLDNATIH